ncbi:MAG: hypothetical protein GXX86_06915 [Propionibacterium sp.]|nr:hypothetical protein [Propionibacterium sp.]
MRIRRAVPALLLVSVLGLAACTEDSPPQSPTTPTGVATEPTGPPTNPDGPDFEPKPDEDETTEPAEPTETEGEGTEGFDAETKQTDGFPELTDTELLPTEVRIARQDGFDRVVVEFTGEGTLGYRAQYADEAVEPGSGNPITVPGDHLLEVIITGTRIPNEGEDFAERGDVPANDATVVQGANFFPPYEGQSQLVIGTNGEAPFRVQELSDPTRLVIDVAHD